MQFRSEDEQAGTDLGKFMVLLHYGLHCSMITGNLKGNPFRFLCIGKGIIGKLPYKVKENTFFEHLPTISLGNFL